MHKDLDDDFKDMQIRLYNIFITKLKDVINRLERLMDQNTNGNGVTTFSVRKGKYVLIKQHLDSAIDEMERWQTRFDPTWKLIMLRSSGPSVDVLLSHHDNVLSKGSVSTAKFKATGPLRRMVKDGQSSGVSVFLPAAQLNGMDIQYIPFSTAEVYQQLSSKRCYVVDTVELGLEHVSKGRSNALAKTVRDLAEKLQFVESPTTGMLQCKGYVKREEGGFRFVFRQPQNTDSSRRPQSLRSMILSASEHSLSERMNIAKQLARAVSYFHSLGFVHKNIRPETIIGFWINGQSVSLESVFLTGFGQFRSEGGATSLLGDDVWEKNLYRHPDRQGEHPEEEYVMQHDIYSLGVCLLEIGLWTSFVIYDAQESASRGHAVSSMVDARGSRSPTAVKAALVQMAREQLPRNIGDRFCSIVVNCLTCLDEGHVDFADESQFTDEIGIQLGVKYIEKILLALEDIEI